MKKILIFLFITVFLIQCSDNQSNSQIDSIKISKIRFNSEGDRIIGNLFYPANFTENKRYAVIIVGGSWTTVKEQMAKNYAIELVKSGFIILTFDHRFYGESGGEPRNYESPKNKIQDYTNAITYLSTLPFVDKRKINLLGVCASAGYISQVAINETRINRIAFVAAWLHEPSTVEIIYGGKKRVLEKIKMAKDAIEQYKKSKTVIYVPAISTTNKNAAMYGNWDYYLNPNRGAIKEWKNRFAVMSWIEWLTFNPIEVATLIKVPVMFIHSKDAALPQGVTKFYNNLQVEKQIYWTNGTQFEFYDNTEKIRECVNKAVEFFRK